ncbi:hypothetical protein SO802_031984 [Lithocarpus litseifolius]|uniref:RNase H type-1 domain-containing protein n=1 Tax=Lithocarpus litseifolius TaxID=425828 RepID=A0AAW2BNU9_9ROSI
MKQTRIARVKWTAPNRNGYKTNFDGVMFYDSGEAGLGVVIRNHEGEVTVELFGKIPLPPFVAQLQLIAARRAVLFFWESFSFSHVYRQGNSVANALAKKARFDSFLTVWKESVLPDICTHVLADRPFLINKTYQN